MTWIYRVGLVVSIGVMTAFLFHSLFRDEVLFPEDGSAYQLITGDDGVVDRSRWDALFSTESYIYGREPAVFLKDHIDLLPVGKALDIAMGEGRNAVFLAKKGFGVEGVDISEVALRKARRLARENDVTIGTIQADLREYQIPENSYEVILKINYLQRSLVPQIRAGLQSGGVVVFENHTVDQLNNPEGKTIPRDYLLERGELKSLFEGFEIIIYEESNDGKDALASIIARKP
jgi:tellurite methyltransferase